MMIKIFFLAAMVISLQCWADCQEKSGNMVFFDHDDSVEEVEGAQKIAAQKCQNFYVIKSQAEAETVFKKIDSERGEISSLIISGHHVGGVYFGKNFRGGLTEMTDLMDRFPRLKASTRNLYLWGCYTNNIDKLEKWLKSFPNLNYVFGYSHKAPLSNQLTGVDYLERALLHQEELEKIDSLDNVKTYLDQLIPGSSNFHFISAAIYGKPRCENKDFKDFYYSIDQIEGGTKSSIDRITDTKKCKEASTDFKTKYQTMLSDYWSGKKDVLPLNAAGSKNAMTNPIRMDFYPWANKYSFCFPNAIFKTTANVEVGIGQTLNLIYFHTIRDNFFEYFKNDITTVRGQLGANDAQIANLLGKGKELTREEVLELHRLLNKKAKPSSQVKSLNFKLKKFLVDMDDRCADVTWLEDVEGIQPPPKACVEPY